MKNLSYLVLFFLSVIMFGCAETEQPYVGYIVVERVVVAAAAAVSFVAAHHRGLHALRHRPGAAVGQ